MASLSKADSRRMYSWWWNSHISPKNSKWLQENLTDVDIKVKAMIKLIEEDADSFARRAEMYYKKRPELMKLVEELYRAYRALAERYDHATGALRQAHKTMTEAFPNQVPAGCDDSATNSPYDTDPQTPDSRTTRNPYFDPDELQKDGSTGTARKALNFSDTEDASNDKNGTHDRNLESVGVDDKEILLLKEALAKLEDEKEAGLKQYIESLDKLAKLENEILKSQEESSELADRASKAEAESRELKDVLQKLEAEKEESLEHYRQAQKKIEEINEQNLKEEIDRLKNERDAAYDQYKRSLNSISDLENKLREAETEIETLKLAIAKLTEEKDAQTVSYQKCMETVASLELRLVCAQEETERLKTELDNGVLRLKEAEEQRLVLEKSNKSLHMELTSMEVKIGSQSQEITEKQKELGRLWTCIQEERLRFVEAETAFQTLQQLHAQSQEELRSMAGELQNRAQILREIETRNEVLEQEIQKQIEKERESTIQKVEELNVSLALQNQEHVIFAEKNGKQLHAMRSEIQRLQEERRNKSKEFEEELDKAFDSEINIFVLSKCVQDLEENNLSLFNDYRKLQEALQLSESLVRVLKQEKTESQIKIKSLSDQNNRLKNGTHQLLKFAGISLHAGSENGQEQTYFDSIQKTFEAANRAVIENEEKNMKLVVEISILAALLRQFKTEVADLEAEKRDIQQELRVQSEKILGLENEAQKMSETNEALRCKLIEGDINESGLRTQLGNIQCELSIAQEAFRTLQMENSAVLEDNKSLLKDNFHIKSKIRASEEENGIFLTEVLSQNILAQALKNYVDEKHEEMSTVEKKLEDAGTENVDLKKSLEKSEHELKTVISVRDRLNSDLANTSNLLQVKEKEHKEAVEQIMMLENDKNELSEILADLRRENDEVKTTNDQQRKQILELLQENDHLSIENQISDVKMQELTENLEKTEEKARFLETEGSLVYGDLQTSTMYQVLLEEKIRELTKVCLNLQEEYNAKDVNHELLKEKTDVLECENADLKARLAAYGPALESLKDSIVSLEDHICIRTKVPESDNEDAKGGESATMERDAFVELQDLQSKVKVIETAVVEMQMRSMQQKLDSDAKLESAMQQIEELSSQKSSRSKPKSRSEISEAADPKDIMLDQASECSSYGVSKRGTTEGEIWETANDSKSMYIHNPTASDVSLDNIVDKLEVSRRFKESRGDDESKRKVLERLNSDVLKLTNLQITIEDLKRKVEITLRSRRGKAMIECETLKGQLMEAESAIQKLYELNGKFVKQIEGIDDGGESESMRRKKVSEQARRVSEKIGRLQLEIQKIQFVLVKLDDETEAAGKTRFMDSSKRVLLKDYLYGGGRTKATVSSSRRKKGHFCACVEPSTKGD
ncbi:putative protein Networked (NET), actin-binding (NAB) [Helianthus annuus]|nr:putative protein Networked (NET), actin-binding (NAB) [Helianthus annuus]KAJ0829096.1 putative protein Networked (NET), actin-binding (NAB) [Helianthus annuus]